MDFLPLLNWGYGSTGYKDKFTNYNWTEGIGTIPFLHLLLLCLCLIFKYISIPQLLFSVLVLAVIGFWTKLGVPCHGELLPSQLFHWQSKNIVLSHGCNISLLVLGFRMPMFAENIRQPYRINSYLDNRIWQ